MAKDGVVSKEMPAARCVGAHRINNLNEGRGKALKFVNIPDSIVGALIEELCGLDDTYSHPLKGAAYYTDSNDDGKTFNLIVSQNDCKEDIAKVFTKWFMRHCYIQYADFETRTEILMSQKVPA